MDLRIEREGKGVALRLPANEQALVRSLAADLVETLGEAPGDPALRRLTPPAYDDAADEQGYREIMGAELRNGRVQALELLAATAGNERLSAEEAESWLRALNDLRLVLGTRLDVQEGSLLDRIDSDDPDAAGLAVYAYLSWLQEQLVEALSENFS
ncbi:MAG: DUF2017 family protein [Gaiellaceae bacterium]